MTTLSQERRRATARSGGRIAVDRPAAGEDLGYPTVGSAALQPRRDAANGGTGRAGRTSQIGQTGRAGGTGTARLQVAPPAPVIAPRAPFVALVLFVVVSGVLGILVINTKINENVFRLHELRQQQAVLEVQQQKLDQELADRQSPGNLAAEARRLGLVPAGTPAFIELSNGRVLGVPRPANGQPVSGGAAGAAGASAGAAGAAGAAGGQGR